MLTGAAVMLSAAPYHEHLALLYSRQLLELHAGHGLAGHVLCLAEHANASANGLRGQLVVTCDHYHLQSKVLAEWRSAQLDIESCLRLQSQGFA